jgi:hypothetical protein
MLLSLRSSRLSDTLPSVPGYASNLFAEAGAFWQLLNRDFGHEERDRAERFGVAQSFTLPYRRIPFCRAPERS